jgi:hypothetical protein
MCKCTQEKYKYRFRNYIRTNFTETTDIGWEFFRNVANMSGPIKPTIDV